MVVISTSKWDAYCNVLFSLLCWINNVAPNIVVTTKEHCNIHPTS